MSMYGVGTHRRIFNTSWTEVGHSVFDHPEIDLTNSLDQLATSCNYLLDMQRERTLYPSSG